MTNHVLNRKETIELFDKQVTYAIRKTLLGVGSVAVGSLFLTGQVEASELDSESVEGASGENAEVFEGTALADDGDIIIVEEVSEDDVLEDIDASLATGLVDQVVVGDASDIGVSVEDDVVEEDAVIEATIEDDVSFDEANQHGLSDDISDDEATMLNGEDISLFSVAQSDASFEDDRERADIEGLTTSINKDELDEPLGYGRDSQILTYEYDFSTIGGGDVLYDDVSLEVSYDDALRNDLFRITQSLTGEEATYSFRDGRRVGHLYLGTLQPGMNGGLPVIFGPGSGYSDRERTTELYFRLVDGTGLVLDEKMTEIYSGDKTPEPFFYEYPEGYIEGERDASQEGNGLLVGYVDVNADEYVPYKDDVGVHVGLVFDEAYSPSGRSPLGEGYYIGVTSDLETRARTNRKLEFVERRGNEDVYRVKDMNYYYDGRVPSSQSVDILAVHNARTIGITEYDFELRVYDESLLPVRQIDPVKTTLAVRVAPLGDGDVLVNHTMVGSASGYKDVVRRNSSTVDHLINEVAPNATIESAYYLTSDHPLDRVVTNYRGFLIERPASLDGTVDFTIDSLVVETPDNVPYSVYGLREGEEVLLDGDDLFIDYDALRVVFDEVVSVNRHDSVVVRTVSSSEAMADDLDRQRVTQAIFVESMKDGDVVSTNEVPRAVLFKKIQPVTSHNGYVEVALSPSGGNVLFGDTVNLRQSGDYRDLRPEVADGYEYKPLDMSKMNYEVVVDGHGFELDVPSDVIYEVREEGNQLIYTFGGLSPANYQRFLSQLAIVSSVERLDKLPIDMNEATATIRTSLIARDMETSPYRNMTKDGDVWRLNGDTLRVKTALPTGVMLNSSVYSDNESRSGSVEVGLDEVVYYDFNFVNRSEHVDLGTAEILIKLPEQAEGALGLSLVSPVELNKDGFEVQYSMDGETFSADGDISDARYIKVVSLGDDIEGSVLSGTLALQITEGASVSDVGLIETSYRYDGLSRDIVTPSRDVMLAAPVIGMDVNFLIEKEGVRRPLTDKEMVEQYGMIVDVLRTFLEATYNDGLVSATGHSAGDVLITTPRGERTTRLDGLQFGYYDDDGLFKVSSDLDYGGHVTVGLSERAKQHSAYSALKQWLDAGVVEIDYPGLTIRNGYDELNVDVVLHELDEKSFLLYEVVDENDRVFGWDIKTLLAGPEALRVTYSLYNYIAQPDIHTQYTYEEFFELNLGYYGDVDLDFLFEDDVTTLDVLAFSPDLKEDMSGFTNHRVNNYNLPYGGTPSLGVLDEEHGLIFRAVNEFSLAPHLSAGLSHYDLTSLYHPLDLYHMGVISRDDMLAMWSENVYLHDLSLGGFRPYVYINPDNGKKRFGHVIKAPYGSDTWLFYRQNSDLDATMTELSEEAFDHIYPLIPRSHYEYNDSYTLITLVHTLSVGRDEFAKRFDDLIEVPGSEESQYAGLTPLEEVQGWTERFLVDDLARELDTRGMIWREFFPELSDLVDNHLARPSDDTYQAILDELSTWTYGGSGELGKFGQFNRIFNPGYSEYGGNYSERYLIRDYDRMKREGVDITAVENDGLFTTVTNYVTYLDEIPPARVYIMDDQLNILEVRELEETGPMQRMNDLQYLEGMVSEYGASFLLDEDKVAYYVDEDGFEWRLVVDFGAYVLTGDEFNLSPDWYNSRLEMQVALLERVGAIVGDDFERVIDTRNMGDLSVAFEDAMRYMRSEDGRSVDSRGEAFPEDFLDEIYNMLFENWMYGSNLSQTGLDPASPTSSNAFALVYELAPGARVTTAFETLDGQTLRPTETVLENQPQKTAYAIDTPPAELMDEEGHRYVLVTDLSSVSLSGVIGGQDRHVVFKYERDDEVRRVERDDKEVVLPFDEEVIEDNTLPEGEVVIEVGGEDGLVRTWEEDLYLNDQFVRTDKKEEQVKDSVTQVKRIGTGVVSENVVVDTEEIPVKVEVVEDPSLPEGQEVIDQEGEPGELTITTTTPTLNGEPSGEPIVTKEITKEMTPTIKRVGTGVVSEKVVTEVKEIPVEVEVIEDISLPEGEEVVVEEGTPGELTVTTKTPLLNGEPSGEPTVTEEVTKEMTPTIKRVGTGVVSEKVTTEVKEIPAPKDPVIKENPNLPEGEEKVVQEAQPGQVEITTTTPTLNGEPSGDPVVTERVVEEPTPEVIEVGTGVVGEEVTTTTEVIPYEVERRENLDLPEGEERVIQVGVVGEQVTTSVTPTLNGKPYGEPVVTEEVTKEPVTEIIEVGVGVVGEDVTTETKEIPAPDEPVIKENPDLPEGEKRVVQEGTPGVVEVTTKTPTLNGKPSGEPVVIETVTEEPTPEIVEIGTGVPGEEISIEIKEIPAPKEPIVRENPDLLEGEKRVVQEGAPGKVEITTTVPTLNGVPTGEEPVVTETVIEEPQPQIIEIGTKPEGSEEIITPEDPEESEEIETPEDEGFVGEWVTPERPIEDDKELGDDGVEEVFDDGQKDEEEPTADLGVTRVSAEEVVSSEDALPNTGEASLGLLSGITSLFTGLGLLGGDRRRRRK